MWSWCGKMFFVRSNVATIKDLGDIIYKMFTLLASLVALKFTPIGETLFAKHYMPFVLAAVMVFFLLWIFYTLVLDHTTITTLFPISVLYGIVCAVSFAALKIISPDTNIAIFNLALWLFSFIIIAFIYYQNQSFDGSELPLVQLTVNGDGNTLLTEQLGSFAGQPTTLVIGGDECIEVQPPCMTGFDRDCDRMEENRVVIMMETDAG